MDCSTGTEGACGDDPLRTAVVSVATGTMIWAARSVTTAEPCSPGFKLTRGRALACAVTVGVSSSTVEPTGRNIEVTDRNVRRPALRWVAAPLSDAADAS